MSVPNDTPTKRCSKCGIEYPATAECFHRQTSRTGKPGLRPDCKICVQSKSKAWHLKNIDKHHAYAVEYNLTHRKECTEREQKWRANNPDKARARSNRYYHGHAEERKEVTRNKRAVRRSIPGSFSEAQVRELYKHQNGLCYYCQSDLSKGYHRDHVIPLSRGGTNYISNIVLACPHCNWSKNDRMPHEWPQGGKLL